MGRTADYRLLGRVGEVDMANDPSAAEILGSGAENKKTLKASIAFAPLAQRYARGDQQRAEAVGLAGNGCLFFLYPTTNTLKQF